MRTSASDASKLAQHTKALNPFMNDLNTRRTSVLALLPCDANGECLDWNKNLPWTKFGLIPSNPVHSNFGED